MVIRSKNVNKQFSGIIPVLVLDLEGLEVQIEEVNQMHSNGHENIRGKRCNGKRSGVNFLSTRKKKKTMGRIIIGTISGSHVFRLKSVFQITIR